jgi:D-galacturonate reductase
VQKLSDHLRLAQIAQEEGVLCYVEHHKRFDPAYSDAREKARMDLGLPNYFYSYMSQPKQQLATFASWAGKDSDISYYLVSLQAIKQRGNLEG